MIVNSKGQYVISEYMYVYPYVYVYDIYMKMMLMYMKNEICLQVCINVYVYKIWTILDMSVYVIIMYDYIYGNAKVCGQDDAWVLYV